MRAKGHSPEMRAAFAHRLLSAISDRNLAYGVVAERARAYLPRDARLSGVSVWQYATGKSFPRHRLYVDALARALEIPPGELLTPLSSGEGRSEDLSDIGGKRHSAGIMRIEVRENGRAMLYLEVELSWAATIKILHAINADGET